MPHLIAGVAVEQASFHFDKLYSYLVLEKDRDLARVGARVLVPFGKGNRCSAGVIFTLEPETDVQKIKPIARFLDEEALVTESMVRLAAWLKDRTFCTYYDAVRVQLPAGAGHRIVVEYAPAPALREGQPLPDELPQDARTVLECLRRAGKPVAAERLLEALGMENPAALEEMCERGWIVRTDDAVRKIGDATVRLVSLAASDEELEHYFSVRKASEKQKKVVEFLQQAGCASVKEILYFTGVTPVVIRTLQKHGLIYVFEREVYRRPRTGDSLCARAPLPPLTPAQQDAVEKLRAHAAGDGAHAALLFGVTGSGKTRVYLELIRETVDAGGNCIMMVPEISLTPQLVSKFRDAFGDNIAVLHSGLSMGERLDEWKRIRRGEVQIAIGTRSAVFAPFERVSLLILDEEQEGSYKSEASPRYHARDVAKYRAARDGGLLLLGSATPSLESYYAAVKGKYLLVRLPARYGDAVLPEVIVTDMCAELAAGVSGSIGRRLYEEIGANLQAGEQTILLHNRRGFHTFVVCSQCQSVYTCPNCSISMTYHAANGRLMCHYCGYSTTPDVQCPTCGGKEFRFSGSGTQRLEEELHTLFPQASVLRMDADTTAGKDGHDALLTEFAGGNYDILLGTQMVAKGLDFPRVSLVGVISADQTLYSTDFRSYERAFSLLTQVVGRSGRGSLRGRAVVQTFTPENPVLALAAQQDYEKFFEEEIAKRRTLLYPPFCDLCEISFTGLLESRVQEAAQRFFALLVQRYPQVPEKIPIKVLGPSPASIARIGRKYRYRLIVKCRNDAPTRRFLAQLLREFLRDGANRNVMAYVDVNPATIY